METPVETVQVLFSTGEGRPLSRCWSPLSALVVELLEGGRGFVASSGLCLAPHTAQGVQALRCVTSFRSARAEGTAEAQTQMSPVPKAVELRSRCRLPSHSSDCCQDVLQGQKLLAARHVRAELPLLRGATFPGKTCGMWHPCWHRRQRACPTERTSASSAMGRVRDAASRRGLTTVLSGTNCRS